MTNHALRRAMMDARKTEQDLARAAKVDVKTVSRWLTNPGRFPHPNHRWAVSECLGVDETVLWPEVTKMLVKTGADRELEQCWPVRALMPSTTWAHLLEGARSEITLAGWTCYFFWLEVPGMAALVRRKAAQGCRVRFLLGAPDDPATAEREAAEATPLSLTVRLQVTLSELAKLRDVEEGLEARFADRRLLHMSVFRFDNKAIVTPHLASTIGTDAPTFLLRRIYTDGLFDRFTKDHVEELWTGAKPVW